MPSKRRPVRRSKAPKLPLAHRGPDIFEDHLEWVIYELADSSISHPKVRESVADKEGWGTTRVTRNVDLSQVPAHLMDDDYDNMELVNDGKGVAKLESNHLDKAFRDFYSLDDLEDVDE